MQQDAYRKANLISYRDNRDGTITDLRTGLIWQKEMGEKMTLEEAQKKLYELNKGKYSDWRIPSIKELFSLVNYSGQVFGDKVIALFIDTVFFDQPKGDIKLGEREIDAQTWSVTDYNGFTMGHDQSRFGVNFLDGRLKAYPVFNPHTHQPNKLYFRFVRGNPDYGLNKFKDNGDSTITDLATGLIWQKFDSKKGMDWSSAFHYANDLKVGGYDDWRLPTVKELQSIVDYTISNWGTATPAIDSIFQITSIQDPDQKLNYPFFWSSTTLLDGPSAGNFAAYVCFGRATAKMNGRIVDAHGAGAVRSDPKSTNGEKYPKFFGPQGDIQSVYNFVRCVRSQYAIE